MKKIRKFFLVTSILLICLIISNTFNIRGQLYMLFKGVPQQVMLAKIQEYKEVKSKNFIIRFNNSVEHNTVELVATTAEKHYDFLCNLYGYTPEEKPVIIIYDDPSLLISNANLAESKPPMGVYYASIISILTPKQWIPNDMNTDEVFVKQGPIVHEVTHLFIDNLTKGNCPLWFTEGLALYSEFITEEYEWGEDIDLYDIYTVEELENFKNQDPYLAYTQSFRNVKYIADKHGFGDINDIIKYLGSGEDFKTAYEKATGSNISEIDNKPDEYMSNNAK